MNISHFLAIVCLSIATFVSRDTEAKVNCQETTPSEKKANVDVRALLEKGLASGSLPEGMVIRLNACLGGLDEKGKQDGLPPSIQEQWEFTPGKVSRIGVANEDENDLVQSESRPFESKGLCKELLDGKAVEIATRKGQGPEIGFVGSRYGSGSRSIEVVWKGETVLSLFETNGPFLQFYNESDAKAFGTLYERLANQARDTFKSDAPTK